MSDLFEYIADEWEDEQVLIGSLLCPPTQTEITVDLNGWKFDGVTPDSGGFYWSWIDFDGWFAGPPARVETAAIQPDVGLITVARRNPRLMTLHGLVHACAGAKLGQACYAAMRRLKANCSPLDIPQLLKVAEPSLNLRSYVRMASGGANPRFRPVGGNAWVEFELDLIAPDWRRYAETAVTNTDLSLGGGDNTDSTTLAVAGDATTPPVFTIDGPATQPRIRNDSLTNTPILWYAGTLGGSDSLVFDSGARTAILNGTTDVRASLTGAEWFFLRPGNNLLTYIRSSTTGISGCQVDYRPAYT